MKCPNCKRIEMKPVLTRQGVEVDYCETCQGVWLDKGEIYYFTPKRTEFWWQLSTAIQHAQPSGKYCPRTGTKLQKIRLFDGELILDYSPVSQGIWFDASELETLTERLGKKFSLSFDNSVNAAQRSDLKTTIREKLETHVPGGAVLLALPNLVARSSAVLVLLYGLLSLVLITASLFIGLSPFGAFFTAAVILAIQFAAGPFLTDFMLRFLYRLEWVPYQQLPSHLSRFIQQTCKVYAMKPPRIGIIDDGAPNAFTYGHTPNNARVVFTRGMLDLLDEEETESVIAHEIGHARHWDMLIMTAAQLVPLVLYYLYRTFIRMRSRGNDKSAAPRLLIAITSYMLYIVSEYCVLWLSRTREYYADRFAGKVTGNPNALTKALVKIGYGLAGKVSEKASETSKSRKPALEAVGALGIFDSKSSAALAISSFSSSSSQNVAVDLDKDKLREAMKWDLWNPWARFYEFSSTHPLIAHRIHHLGNQAEVMGLEPFIRFNLRKPESYWDEFLVDIILHLLPVATFLMFVGISALTAETFFIGAGLVISGTTSLLKTFFSYPNTFFPEMSVASLLGKVKVSAVRPVPCKLKGTIIGRGVPGLIWSEDFVMQDETGILFLDYRQPIPVWDFFFGLLRSNEYQGKTIEVTGWYRRSPVPYVELKSIRTQETKQRTCYSYLARYAGAVAIIVLGIFLLG